MFSLNADALIVIINALLWAAHDTRLPETERLIYKDLADKLAPLVPVPEPEAPKLEIVGD
jgi:hypothetical protein